MLKPFRQLLLSTFVGSLILPPLAAISSTRSLGGHFSFGAEVKISLYCLGAVGILAGFLILQRKFASALARESKEQADALDSVQDSLVPFAIVIAAALSLFLELAVIRWQASMFEFFAFYKNFSLLACFAGLGIGYTISRSREGVYSVFIIPLFSYIFALLIFLLHGLPVGQAYSLEMIPFHD